MDTAALPRGTKAARRHYHPSPSNPRASLMAGGPMRFSMPRHHWAGGTLLPAVRRTPALHEQGRRQRLFLLVEQEERVCINRAQRRADATRSTLLACHAYHWTAGGCQGGIPRVSVVVQARQQRVAETGRALMQRRQRRGMAVLLIITNAMRRRPFGQVATKALRSWYAGRGLLRVSEW